MVTHYIHDDALPYKNNIYLKLPWLYILTPVEQPVKVSNINVAQLTSYICKVENNGWSFMLFRSRDVTNASGHDLFFQKVFMQKIIFWRIFFLVNFLKKIDGISSKKSWNSLNFISVFGEMFINFLGRKNLLD